MEKPELIVKSHPLTPGIYMFSDAAGTIIYIGKAKQLRRRVSQYFSQSIPVSSKTGQMVSRIASVKTVETKSEFDAILLEAKLIREYKPKYNIIAKDDKSPIYVAITTDERMPRILFVRKRALETIPGRTYFGPFQSAKTVRNILKELRRIFPYCTQKQRNGKPCFYTHIGLCMHCPSVIEKLPAGLEKRQEILMYKKNITHIIQVLSGKSVMLVRTMNREMSECARKEEFEKAQDIKERLIRLASLKERHFDPSYYISDLSVIEHTFDAQQSHLLGYLSVHFPKLKSLSRIECFDISNTGGTNATGSMVVLTDGKPDTAQYRRFSIKSAHTPDDFRMIAEIVSRRLKHSEWALPDLIVIDGGKGQTHAAQVVLDNMNLSIPLIGLAKRYEEVIVPKNGTFETIRIPLSDIGLHLLQRVRDESHRFALTYHMLLRSKSFLRTGSSGLH